MLGLWLALAICASPDASGQEVQLTAERILHDGKQKISTAEGQAKLLGADFAVDADRIVYDQQRHVATATGHVVARVARGGKVAVIADLVTLRLDDQDEVTDVYLFDGRAFSKKDVPLETFLAADTPARVEQAGTTQALLTGNHLERVPGTGWRVEALELVPCDCDFKDPSWSITSSSAVIDTGDDRVSVTNPVVRVKGVPVLWLPWLSLPLTDRQSGLLFPRLNPSGLNGFSLEQPVFLTLGRSADVTLTPGFFTGGTGPLGMAGPRLGTEFRYAPSARATGRVVLGLLYDFRPLRDVESAVRVAGSRRGWRGELSWLHTQDFDRGFGVRADLNGHSDGDYNRDLTVDVIASAATYLRSSATAFHRGTNHSLTLDVGLRQDIQWGYDWLGNGTLLNKADRVVGPFGPGTLQRLPALTFGWSPDPLGPVRFTLDAEAVRLAPLFSSTGDEGTAAQEGKIEAISFKDAVARMFQPTSRFLSQSAPLVTPSGTFVTSDLGNRVWASGEREARDRLMIKPTLAASFTPAGALSVSASASWRQLGWAGEASGRSFSRGYLLLGGALETQLSRWFGDGAVRHVIQPRFEVRAIPFGYQAAHWAGATAADSQRLVPYDQTDFAVPNVDPRVQGVLELRQRLVSRAGEELLRLEVGQGAELTAPSGTPVAATLAETYAGLGFRLGWASGSGQVRVDPLAGRVASDGVTAITTGLTRLAGRLELDDGRGHGAYGTYENLLMEGTVRSRQPLDLLFLVDRGYTSATRAQMLTFGARWNFGAVSVRYDALLLEQAFPLGDGSAGTRPALAFSQHALSVGISPACDCWRVDVTATQPIPWTRGVPTLVVPMFGASLTVARFGTIGSR